MWSNGKVVKRAMPPDRFIEIRAFKDLMEQPTNLVIGHTRAPTSGGKGDQQAQPFKQGDVVTVHNGVIHNTEELVKKYSLTYGSGVDSELFASFIAKNGLEDLPDFMSNVQGNAALGIVLNNNELYLIRDGNPTEYIILPISDGTTVTVFGSTMGLVNDAINHTWLAGRRNTITSKHGALLRLTGESVTVITEPKVQTTCYTYYPQPDTSHSRGRQHRLSLRWDHHLGMMVDKVTGVPVQNIWGAD